MKIHSLAITLLLIAHYSGFSVAQESDTTKKIPHFELSFGQSLLFISDGQLAKLRNSNSVILPTSAILFFAEFRPHKTARIPVFLNIPTESKQYLINGQMVYQRASPTFGFGTQFKLFDYQIDKKSKLEFEMGPLVSFIFDQKDNIRVAPIVAGRFRLMRGDDFVMYLGASYSVGINAFGLLYGTGTIF